MARTLVALVFVFFLNFTHTALAQESGSHGPAVTLTMSAKSAYVISAGFKLDNAVEQNDLFVNWSSGWYFDFWTSTSLSTPGFKAHHGGGNEIDFSVGRVWHPGACEVTAEVADYLLVPTSDMGNDFLRGKVALARSFKRSGLTPHIELQEFVGSGSRAFTGGQVALLGLGSSKGFAQDITLVRDGGVADAEKGFIVHYSTGKSFRDDKSVGAQVGLDLYEPITVSDRKFEWVASVAAVFHLK